MDSPPEPDRDSQVLTVSCRSMWCRKRDTEWQVHPVNSQPGLLQIPLLFCENCMRPVVVKQK